MSTHKDSEKNSTTPALVNSSNAQDQTFSTRESLSAYFTIAAAAFGLISDGYQNNLMTMSNVVFKKLYPHDYTSSVSTRVSNSLLVGAIIGQVIVGLVCDRVGRKVALVSTTLLIVLGATLGTVAHGAHGSVQGLFWFLTFARGITGIGVGGEYPASSTSASEAANEKMIKHRGPVFIMVTNFVLSFGGPLAVSVFLIVISAAGEDHLPTVWRVCFGIGIVLPLTVLIFRLRMLSSKLFRKSAIKRTIISSVIHNSDIKTTAEWQLLLGALALPGVFVGAWLCDPLGRRNTMMVGFSGYLVIGLIMGVAYEKITNIIPLFVIFYGLMQSFGNLGPGDMLGLVSAEKRSYPTPIRGTCYGLSAAIGKVGAAVGTQAFTPIQNNLGKKYAIVGFWFIVALVNSPFCRWTFIIAAICGVTGILVTYFFVPDMTGIDLADEDARFMEYLKAEGWEGEVGEDDDRGLVRGPSLTQCDTKGGDAESK
ncbi:hypothetical protein EW146_g582 [Bondarzewia mesenterica]|uniref:Major facilitator superfamily (MFS) profile domain-containing protein n=1 Tax=Bondarzewia mesenterica TaxID=1095465 RepID=A0A4S4M6T0_9AGAM|nr:hypothetical protein EW146_g582 [Bondarzewia mesenterica]